MNIEIERKFLLKSYPDKTPAEIIAIEQWYLKKKDIWERVRMCTSDKNGVYYIHTVKKQLSKKVNLEDEKKISKEEYDSFINDCNSGKWESRFISKERWVYPHLSDNLKWEVDIFNGGHHLVIAEIEIPKKAYVVEVPDFINDKLLLEVTGMKQFSNKNLSDKLIQKTSI